MQKYTIFGYIMNTLRNIFQGRQTVTDLSTRQLHVITNADVNANLNAYRVVTTKMQTESIAVIDADNQESLREDLGIVVKRVTTATPITANGSYTITVQYSGSFITTPHIFVMPTPVGSTNYEVPVSIKVTDISANSANIIIYNNTSSTITNVSLDVLLIGPTV